MKATIPRKGVLLRARRPNKVERPPNSKEAVIAKYMSQAALDARREWLQSLKDKPCKRCGIKYHRCAMDWHHVDPSTKLFKIASKYFRIGKQRILEEVSKCELYCSNCHRIIEFEVKHGITIPLL